MTMYNIDVLPNDDISKDWKESIDGWQGRWRVYHHGRNVIHLETIGEVPHACSLSVGMRYDNNLI
jgi:hypothetical protein